MILIFVEGKYKFIYLLLILNIHFEINILMADVYKKVYIHLVFAVKNRNALLDKKWRSDVFGYIAGILKRRGHYPLAVNGHYDHVHLLFDYSLKELISDLVREIKKSSSDYIKDEKLCSFKFNWQGDMVFFQ